MPSRRHSAEIVSSPRSPSRTMRIFSSAPYCLRVTRRMSLMTFSAGALLVPDFCLIFAPLKDYDEPEILPSQLSRFGPVRADAGQRAVLASIKKAVRAGMEMPLNEGLKLERALFHETLDLPDRQEGMRAFTERRKPLFNTGH